jgi:hypothetical protein
MRANKNREVVPALHDISKQDAPVEPQKPRRRLPLPVIRSGRPATLDLTNQKIDEILFG